MSILNTLKEQLNSRSSSPFSAARPPTWCLAEVAGRLVELTGTDSCGVLSSAMLLVRDAQATGELVVWIAVAGRIFFPPDADANGVDLRSLIVVRASDAQQAVRAADRLLRSGAFALVVLDLGADCDIALPQQARLVGLAQKYLSAVVCLTSLSTRHPTLGSLVSLRVRPHMKQQGFEHHFQCELTVLKDKRRGLSWDSRSRYEGPPGFS